MVARKTKSLASELSSKAKFTQFDVWIIGDTPLITHAWSEKAKRQMLEKQGKAIRPGGLESRDPEADFRSSLYEMGDGVYGFPAMGVKNCMLSAAHKDKGIARSAVMAALWLDADMVRVRPAMAGAVCDMPLFRIWGSEPEMREDMVRIGIGLTKKANLAYRAQFSVWALRVSGLYNTTIINDEALQFLIKASGMSAGLGEWRNERKGMFGAFHLAVPKETKAWDAFAAGKGPLPVSSSYKEAA